VENGGVFEVNAGFSSTSFINKFCPDAFGGITGANDDVLSISGTKSMDCRWR